METNGVTANQPNPQSNSLTSKSKLSSDLNSFLKILTAQLKSQDPLDPLDTHEFTNQLVLFSGVEQAIQQNANLEKLIAIQNDNIAVGALSFMGKEVEALGQTAMLRDGRATFSYTLPNDAAGSIVRIIGPDGKTVLEQKGETKAGRHEFLWNGKDKSGNKLPDGAYSIKVDAADAKKQPLKVIYSVTGKVTGVQLEKGVATLNLGDAKVPLKQVIRIREAGDNAPGG